MRRYLYLSAGSTILTLILILNINAFPGEDCVDCTYKRSNIPPPVIALAKVAEQLPVKMPKMKKSNYCEFFKRENAGLAIATLNDFGKEEIDYLTYNECILTIDKELQPPTFNAAESPEDYNDHIYSIINRFKKNPQTLSTIFNAKNKKGKTLLDFIDIVHPNRDPSNEYLNQLIAYVCANGGQYTSEKKCPL